MQSNLAIHATAEKTGRKRGCLVSPDQGDERQTLPCDVCSPEALLCFLPLDSGTVSVSFSQVPFILPGLSGFAFLINRELLTESVAKVMLFAVGVACQRPSDIPECTALFILQMCIRCCIGQGSPEKQNQEEIRAGLEGTVGSLWFGIRCDSLSYEDGGGTEEEEAWAEHTPEWNVLHW